MKEKSSENAKPDHKNIFEPDDSQSDDEIKEGNLVVGFETYGKKPNQKMIFSNAFTTEQTNENEEIVETEEDLEKKLREKLDKKYEQVIDTEVLFHPFYNSKENEARES